MSLREQADERQLRAQLEALNEASIAITAELSLERVLQRIVDLARNLAGARYAALGVPDERGDLQHFVTSGMTADEVKRVDHLPRGAGLLGVLLREPKPIRIPDITRDPRSAGFAANHPVMHSFLGVPIVSRGRLLGNLYLTDKIGAPEFSEDDERLIGMLSKHAAIAIDNAHLMQETIDRGRQIVQRNRELETLNTVVTTASQSLNLDSLLRDTLDKILSVLEAEAAEVFLREEASGDMILAIHRGVANEAFRSRNRFERGEGFPGIVSTTGQPLISGDIEHDERFDRQEVIQAGFKSFACVPLTIKNQVIGAMALAARSAHSFDDRKADLLSAIGKQMGVAVENARLYREVGRLAVVEERARIGMELHDGIMQSIYAVGLTLEYALLVLDEQPGASRERLTQAIGSLNEIIRDIRNYILDMRPRRFEGQDLAAGLSELARAFRANTFINIDVDIDREASAQASPELSTGLFHITQEGLANVAKHARARNVWLSFKPESNGLILELRDDGRGFDPMKIQRYAGHGMRNMEERARLLNSQWQVESAPNRGTRIRVIIPLNHGI